MPARAIALRVLTTCRVSEAWADAALSDELTRAHPDPRDAALSTRIVYGVLQNRALLDYYIAAVSDGRPHFKPLLKDILRIGAYQILFLEKVPDPAAVNRAVEQAGQKFTRREAGLTNALLRALSAKKAEIPLPKDYSVLYSHPAPLVDLIKASAGKRLQAILAEDNSAPAVTAQVNPLKGDAAELIGSLAASHVDARPHPWLPGAYLLESPGSIEQLSVFREGLMQIQDAAARLSVEILPLQKGMKVLDLCAAPGGKSLAVAQRMENCLSVTACDLHAGKLPQITAAAQRLGVSCVTTMQNDASALREEWLGAYDIVIADVPCSGLGVIRKKPDIRYKSMESMEGLPEVQAAILSCAARYVRPGGYLSYSTCTILRRENSVVAEAFLASHPEFHPVPLTLPAPLAEDAPGMLTLYQGVHDCDGFFMCLMRREA